MKINQEIAFKLVNIRTVEFVVIENQLINEDTLESAVEIGFGFSDKHVLFERNLASDKVRIDLITSLNKVVLDLANEVKRRA